MNRDFRRSRWFIMRPSALRIASAALLLFSTGCLADNKTDNFQLAATIDGVAFQGGTVQASRGETDFSIAGGQGSRVLLLQVTIPATPGTVAIGADEVHYASVIDGNSNWITSAGGGGSVVYTLISADELAGTFSFTASAPPIGGGPGIKTVTNGTFRAKF